MKPGLLSSDPITSCVINTHRAGLGVLPPENKGYSFHRIRPFHIFKPRGRAERLGLATEAHYQISTASRCSNGNFSLKNTN